MLLHKTLSLSDVSLKIEGDAGTFAGYASVFGGVDSYGDTIAHGAFAESLAKYGTPKMFFNHEWGMPIGKYTRVAEDEKGLYVEGEFTPDLQLSHDVRSAMKHGTLDGLSIGGYLSGKDYDFQDDGTRLIRTWTRLMEISPVVFPADTAARVDQVKAEALQAIEGIESIRDLERLLRDAGGFSKGAAQALVARARSIFSQGEPDVLDDAKKLDIYMRLREMTR